VKYLSDPPETLIRGAAVQFGEIRRHFFLPPEVDLSLGHVAKRGLVVRRFPAGTRPTAVFCANDLLALGVLQEMTARRIRVPESIALVGYDDIDFAAAAAVPLSSVRQPRHQLGRSAAQLLLDETLGGEAHQHRQVIFQPELVIRRSSQAPRRLPLGWTTLLILLDP